MKPNFVINRWSSILKKPRTLRSARFYQTSSNDIADTSSGFQQTGRLRQLEFLDIKKATGTFSVVSYNVLCESYSIGRDNLPQVLGRNNLIIKELDMYNGDIVCLQEVEQHVYDKIFSSYFDSRGYGHHMYLKGRAKDKLMPGDWLPHIDGCVIAYKKSKFSSLEFRDYELRQVIFDKGAQKFGLNRSVFQKILTRDQIMSMAILETTHTKAPKKKIAVANTHLMYSPGNDALTTIQAHLCTHAITKTLEEIEPMGVVFCGDFNTNPKSGTYKYLSEGLLERSSLWMKHNNYPVTDRDFSHPLELKSAHAQTKLGEPNFTLYQSPESKNVVDYIWHNPLLDLSRVLKVDEERVSKHKKLPSIEFPSDHLALMAEFSFVNPETINYHPTVPKVQKEKNQGEPQKPRPPTARPKR